jgi:LuxR family transcriptional regulator, maltose regulon positive regulatory protein
VFVDEGTAMARLVGKLASVQRTGRIELPGEVSADDLERLQGAFRAESPTKRRSDRTDEAVPGVIEPLTDREMQVLGLMAAGRSNQEIADELVVVLDTIKKHVGHILDKLGAANRTPGGRASTGRGVAAVGRSDLSDRGFDVLPRRETPPRSSTFG